MTLVFAWLHMLTHLLAAMPSSFCIYTAVNNALTNAVAMA